MGRVGFGSSVNPITTRGADYAHHITASPPGSENPVASLHGVFLRFHEIFKKVSNKLKKLICCKYADEFM